MRPRRQIRIPPIRPRADPRLAEVLATIGVPAQTPFRPDAFQLEALAAVESTDCLVSAPTGAGKTWIAERAMARALDHAPVFPTWPQLSALYALSAIQRLPNKST